MALTLSEIAADPARHASDIALPDGERGELRPLLPADRDLLEDFFSGLGPATRRFYSVGNDYAEVASSHCADIALYDKLRLTLLLGPEIVGLFEFSLDLPRGDLQRFASAGVQLEAGRDIRFGLCLRDDVQGRGFASATQSHIEDLGRRLGASNLILWGGVKYENAGAIRFYRRTGFVEVASFVDPAGDTSVDMWRDLTSAS